MKSVVWFLGFSPPSLYYSFACNPDAELLWMFSHISVEEKFNVICWGFRIAAFESWSDFSEPKNEKAFSYYTEGLQTPTNLKDNAFLIHIANSDLSNSILILTLLIAYLFLILTLLSSMLILTIMRDIYPFGHASRFQWALWKCCQWGSLWKNDSLSRKSSFLFPWDCTV